MENCCYGKFELLSLALARAGELGTLVHAHGSYGHDLREEVLGGRVNRHYRLENYLKRNCENYPTHELGPIAKILDINRGNRMLSLVSVASKAAGLEEFSYTEKNPDQTLRGQKFAQGDIVNTIITCANGETISLKLDTTQPLNQFSTTYDRQTLLCGNFGNSLFYLLPHHLSVMLIPHKVTMFASNIICPCLMKHNFRIRMSMNIVQKRR